MFNLLVSADENAWTSDQRMAMSKSRFLEFSGDEAEGISANDPASLKRLERVQTILMYEEGVGAAHADTARIGQMRDIRASAGDITFRFHETGTVAQAKIVELAHRLQLDKWERFRTHWAVKDGDIPQELLLTIKPTTEQYDVVLSYAGEDRGYVEQVADFLEKNGVVAFYDQNERASLWGKDLAEHFDNVFRKQGRYCVMFISRHYAEKVWTTHERRSALDRALHERMEYVLPARFDDTEIPGLRSTIGYQDLRATSPQQLGELILEKLGRR